MTKIEIHQRFLFWCTTLITRVTTRYNMTIRRSPRIASKPSVTYYHQQKKEKVQTIYDMYIVEQNIIKSTIIIKNFLDQIDNTRGSDKKCPLVNQLFTHLLYNTDILTYKPFFRNAVINKITQFQHEIPVYISSFNKENTFKDIISFQNNMDAHLTNLSSKADVNKLVESIKQIVSAINTNHYTQTLEITNQLLEVISGLHTRPGYVP